MNGRDTEAKKDIEAALAVGIRDGNFFRHAGEIELKAGDKKLAVEYLQKAASLNSPASDEACLALANLNAASGAGQTR